MSSAYSMHKTACPPILKSPDSSRASLARHPLYKLNTIDKKKKKQLPCLSLSLHSSLPLGPLLLQHSHPWTLRWSIFFCLSLYQLHLGSLLVWLVTHAFKIHLSVFPSYTLTGYTSSLPFRLLRWDFACFPVPSIYATYQPSLLFFNLLKPTGHVMHHQFNIQQLYVLPTLYLCVLYLSENKQRLVPLTA